MAVVRRIQLDVYEYVRNVLNMHIRHKSKFQKLFTLFRYDFVGNSTEQPHLDFDR